MTTTSTPVPNTIVTNDALTLLAEFNITSGFTFDPAFDLSKIAAKSTLQQVRAEKFDPIHVEGMEADLKKTKDDLSPGDQWPAILVWKNSANAYDIVNGIHRTEASRRVGRTTFPAIIIDATFAPDAASLVQQMKVAANRRNGMNLSHDEKIDNACHMYTSGIVSSMKEAAALTGLSYDLVNRSMHERKADDRMVHNGIGALVDALPQNVKIDAAKKISNNKPFRETLKLIHETGMTGSAAKDLVAKVGSLGDQETQMEHISTERARLANQAQAVADGKPLKTPKSTGFKATESLTRIVNKLDPATILGMFPTPADRQQALPTLREQRDALTKAIRAMERADRQTEQV